MPPGDLRAAFLRKPWHRFLSDGDAPPYACMMVTGAARSHNDIRFTCSQPTSVQQPFYMVNGPNTAKDTLEGLCTTLTGAGIIRYDANDGTPVVGEVWGPESGSWSIHKGQRGFVIAGGPRTLADGSTCVVAIQFPSASAGSVVRFRLTGTLPIGESANALLLVWNGAAYVTTGSTITVYDWWGASAGISNRGMFAGDVGMEGMASAREDGSGYDIIWMERYANSIGFTTTENMGASEEDAASATLDYSFEQGVTPPLDGNDELVVHDDQELFTMAQEGAKGWARLNEYLRPDEPENPYYQIWMCDQQAILGHATLEQTMCSGDFEVSISGFVADTFAPFGQDPNPLPEVAYNPYKLSGKNLTQVDLKWMKGIVINGGEEDETQIDWWVIIQVTHAEAQLVSGFEWDSTAGCFKWDIIEGSAQVCNDAQGEYCPPVCPPDE